jgi:hypothetical protein
MTKIAESGSGSICQKHGSPDPYQNVMDPQHLCRKDIVFLTPSCRKEGGGSRPTPGSQRTPTTAVGMLRGSGAQRQDSAISPSIVSYFTPKNGGDGGDGGGSTPVSLGKRGLKRRLTDTMQGGGCEVRSQSNELTREPPLS